jgi:alpha-mannosidase
MPGCYSSISRIKQAHRETENLFYATEKMLAVARLAGYQKDGSNMDVAEKKLLLSQFHDILPGTVIADGEKEGLEILSTAKNIVKEYRTGAFLYLTMGQDKAKDGEYPVFVFNYMPYEVTVPVEVEFMLADQNWNEEHFYQPEVYQNGEKIVSQQIKEDSTLTLDWRKRVVFEGKLKPMGITRFDVKPKAVKWTEKAELQAENLSALLQESLLLGEVELETYDDTADPWGMSDEELISLGKNPKPFRLMTEEETATFCGFDGKLAPVHTIENGDVLTAMECGYTNGKTNAAIEYRFYKNQPFVDLKVTVEYSDKNKMVRLKVPVPKGKVVGDGPYIVEEKPTVGEVTFQKWLGVQTENGQVYSVMNDCLYAGKAEDGYLYFTLLRGAGYCFHPIFGRELYPKDRYLPRVENGRSVFTFRIYQGDIGRVTSLAETFNQKPYAVNIFPTGGESEKLSKTAISLDGDVSLTAVKYKDDGKIVFRVHNAAEKAAEFTLRVYENTVRHTAGAYEIISLLHDVATGEWTVSKDEILL